MIFWPKFSLTRIGTEYFLKIDKIFTFFKHEMSWLCSHFVNFFEFILPPEFLLSPGILPSEQLEM